MLNAWPPPDNLHRVIALIEDCWIEINKQPTETLYKKEKVIVQDILGHSYKQVKAVPIGERPSTWQDPWAPIILNYHGCGCCGGEDETPTHWIPIPEGDTSE